MSPSATPATQSAAASQATNPVQARHQSRPSAVSGTPATQNQSILSPSATPATQNQSRCRQVPRLPRKMPRRHRRLIRSKRASRASPMPQVPRLHATQNEGRCRQVPRLPRKSAAASPATNPVQARHQSRPSAVSGTPATQNAGGCHQVPCLPRKTKVYVAKCHTCHAKRQ